MKRVKRTGLRICGSRGHPQVRAALIRYARWLRSNYSFPIRVPVYLLATERLTTIDGKRGTASCFAPFDRNVEPYIRIATGDWRARRKELNRDDCLAGYLNSLSHEVVHYQQWISTGRMWERGVVRKAQAMVNRYALTVDHP